jgi:hypothetical protein
MSLWRRPALRWTVLALVGLVIATAVTITATRLVGQHVALGGEPRLSDNLVAPQGTSTAPPRTSVTPTRTTSRDADPPVEAGGGERERGDDDGDGDD